MTTVDAVVKLGGATLRDPAAHARATAALARLCGRGCVVVPGGGPLADAVRVLDVSLELDDSSAHWMAVLAMDQHAELLAARVEGAALVTGPEEIATALRAGALPVLAPYRWMRAADPLPHSWTVTSDSIAAWAATVLGAKRLVLVKPIASPLEALVDPWFHRALGAGMMVSAVAPSEVDAIPELLAATSVEAAG